MSISIHKYEPSNAEDWDAFCTRTNQGTFLHTRRFLSYHEKRFLDRSLVLRKKDLIVGLLPAAEKPGDSKTVVSHPGITYGGLLHTGKVMGEVSSKVFESVFKHYAQMGYNQFIYKAVPRIYHNVPCDDDLYAMYRLGAQRVRCDLSSAINLANRLPISSRRKRSFIKAKKAGVVIESGSHLLKSMWEILKKNLKQKHDAKPVHTIDEITHLAALFPENIYCSCAIVGSEVVSGIITFETETCMHAQYIASNEIGYSISALDALFDFLISYSSKRKKQWFDFGISNENEGMLLNDGLYKFKCEFGGGGIVHEHYKINLTKYNINK